MQEASFAEGSGCGGVPSAAIWLLRLLTDDGRTEVLSCDAKRPASAIQFGRTEVGAMTGQDPGDTPLVGGREPRGWRG
jgi:hypothetical protein